MEEQIKQIQLNDLHIALGGKMVPFAGYNMPVRYSSDKEEHLCVRNGVGVFDVSHMGEFMVEGAEALNLIQKVTSNDASKIVNGQAQYSCFPNETGGIVDDLIVYKFEDQKYMLVVNASNIDKDWAWINKHNSMGAKLTNISDEISLFAIQGPKAIEAVQTLTSVDLSEVKFYHFTVGEFAGVPDVIISGTGYTGAGGFEIYVKNENAEKVWNAVFEAGKDFDIKPIGLGARDTLRMEMGYCLYGNDIDDSTSPLEAGLGWITKFTKDFINSDALQEQKEAGVTRKLVGFVMQERGIPRAHYKIVDAQGNEIGEVTSGTQSPSMEVGIGLGYVKKEFSKAGTEIYIQVRNKNLKAQVEKLPLLKK
ncbi:glycine cleavage system aminomethyltransferase GcvT [Algoriphagus halophytocola]|uniref:Aminomethyltransferase n=1 Tax=Algoriphagus halophytocola TaxID=2991499 RepID=A0ABY6MPE3_9BACT|nr:MULTISPECIES: glycine cleavage system aminomethyltransferase GcvT [unclassified Algoriphagus]UZD24099.1 glycine cleavage system aminomethyltransferase GcvT [Algoriphagus sp. TR-M5]WBL41470.1 glycine cleavage system aminomethyltransferase GcvT [Algoriphagus sp. TR-M9]